jgi:hypothetical protein
VDNNHDIIVYDLETTGLDAKTASIIQISGIKVRHDGTKFVEIDKMDHYVNPEVPIPAKITEITGITDDMVVDKPTEKELFPTIKAFFGDNFVASGFNIAKFDNRFMEALYARQGEEFKPICTTDVIEMARDNVDKKETTDFKLGTIAGLYGADKGLTFHNAMDDVTATARLLYVFYDEYRASYDVDEGLVAEEGKKEIGSVTRISFWEGYKGFSRIYITTNIGEFYLDVRSNVWAVKKGNPYDIDEVDMGSLRKKTFEKAGVTTEQELVKKYAPHKGKTTLVPTVINSMRRWERETEKGETMKRIYISTDVGNFFYDIVKDRWASNADSPNEIVDVDSLKALAFAKAGVTSEAEFAKFC